MWAHMQHTRPARWSVSLRAYMMAVMLVALLPLLAHALLSTWSSYSTSRHWAEADLVADAEHLARQVDAWLDLSHRTMALVAESPAAWRGDLAALREHAGMAQTQGLVTAAVLRNPQGAAIFTVGMAEGDTLDHPATGPGPFQAGRLRDAPALVASLPVRLGETGTARLDYAIAADRISALGAEGKGAPWHLAAIADREGRHLWPPSPAPAWPQPLGSSNPASAAGISGPHAGADGALRLSAFARAPTSGLLLAISEPMPAIYHRVPLGPAGAIWLAVAMAAASLALAAAGAAQVRRAYRAATAGSGSGRIRIEEAAHLGADLRHRRDRLFQATGGIAVAELSRPPGGRWQDGLMEVSPNLRAMLGWAADHPLTLQAMIESVDEADRAAFQALGARPGAEATAFCRVVRMRRGDGIRHISVVGLMREWVPGLDDQLTLTLQDITPQKELEQELQVQAERLRLAVDIAALGVFEFNPGRMAGHWSDRMWRMRGLEPQAQAPTLDAAAAMVHPQDRELIVSRTRALWEQPGSAPIETEYRVVWPDGSVHHILSRTLARHDDQGRLQDVFGINLDVTGVRHAIQALETSETRLRLASEAADLGIWDIDLVAGQRMISPRMWRMLGFEPREGAPERSELLDVVLPADHGALRQAWAEIAAGKDVIDYEYRVRLPGGEVRHIHGQGRTVCNAQGRPLRITGISADVTEARRATQALADSEARMRLAVDAADIGVFEFHSRDGTGYWSERNWRMRGLQPREGIPTFAEAENLVHPEDRASATRARHKQLGNPDGGITEHEYRLVWADGTVRHVLSRSITRRSPDGSLLKVVGINIDVTARRLADQRIMRSEARFRLAIETAQLGVWDYDPATGTSVWSDRMREIRGLPPSDSPMTLAEILATTHPEDRGRMAAQVQAQRDGQRPGATETEFRIVRPDGTERLVQSRSVAIHNAEGRLLQVLGINQDITDQRAAEAELREKEATFRLATETASLGIYQINLPEGTGMWSERMYAMRGLQPRPGMPPVDEIMAMVHPDDREGTRARMLAHFRSPGGEVLNYEFRVFTPDGTMRHILARAFSVRDEGGVLRKVIGVNQDITEQKNAEQQLRDSAVRFQLATRTAGLAVWGWQIPQAAGHWSPEMWALHGLPPRATPPTAAEVMATIHPNDRLRAADFMNGLRTNPAEQADAEYRVIHPDGTIRHLSLRATALRDAAGQVASITGIASDITERLLATRALQESESFFRLATEAASQGVWDRDDRTGEVRWSHRMWAICGRPEQPTPPSRAEWEAMLHPDDRAEVVAMLSRLRTYSGDSTGQVAFRIRTPDGTIRHLDMRAMSVHGTDGALARLIGVVVDITEAQELRAQAAIAGNVATLGQLAGGIAHELAQPLQAMIAAADTAALKLGQADDPATREDAREKLARISSLAARAGRTIRHLLAFSRGTSTSGASAVPDAVTGALELVGQSLRQADVHVVVELPDDLPMVVGGLIEIEQVLVNLLLNARDVLEKHPRRRVDIRAARHGDRIELTIADSGPGIPPHVVSRIFDPFFTTKPAGKGTGLGLAISQKTMQAIGGAIAVQTGDEGTTFTLAFQPLEEPAPAAA